MPQLDITTYNSQIFWFLVCFITLYVVTSRVILPRISNILKVRKGVIDADLSAAVDLDEKITSFKLKLTLSEKTPPVNIRLNLKKFQKKLPNKEKN